MMGVFRNIYKYFGKANVSELSFLEKLKTLSYNLIHKYLFFSPWIFRCSLAASIPISHWFCVWFWKLLVYSDMTVPGIRRVKVTRAQSKEHRQHICLVAVKGWMRLSPRLERGETRQAEVTSSWLQFPDYFQKDDVILYFSFHLQRTACIHVCRCSSGPPCTKSCTATWGDLFSKEWTESKRRRKGIYMSLFKFPLGERGEFVLSMR